MRHEWDASRPRRPRIRRGRARFQRQELHDGDAVTVIKDLKVKGSSLVVQVGTQGEGHPPGGGRPHIDCKVDGIGPMKLKSEFVRKA